MAGIRALQRRIKRIEEAEKPKPSPFTVMFGSFDAWVEHEVLPGIESGALDRRDMVAVVAALRNWEHDGTWSAVQVMR
ncbi:MULTISPECIES: hypothetical protein [Sphingobium]|mgnify:FL=1|jgi:hypothetical protein|uniref:Uncharacterized protein n=1 Tax=Sphingobium yanoikuyae TaxID=13690 RepID=A0A0J9D361_SPHYA|nr:MULTISPECIES: hypothetical protein [Sphingobium]ATP19604.1 hypothetical protein BV87_15185 [Sphingobium yanoikuyae]KMW31783.1 hypothetical protein BV87_19995 [Sphingobium yanoikuyae]TKV44783.1 hypothetical protein A0U87_00995 [Sphingobium sp. MP9-4]